jgi:hypothetical protein
LGLLLTLALALPVATAMPVAAQPTFTGDVENDFTGSDVLIFADPGIPGVLDPELDPPWTANGSGWDIKDLRLAYDPGTDILYVGVNSHYMVGDADNDGNETTMTYYGEGTDRPNLSGTECVSVYFDLDQDGTYDVIAGVPAGVTGNPDKDISDFSVNVYLANHLYFGAQLPTNFDIDDVYWDPTLTSGTGDFEFTILHFSLLPGQDDELGAFNVGAFMGSQDDDGIGEDFLSGSTSPAINIVKMTNGTDNNSGPGPYIAVGGTVTWTYSVTNTGTVPLSNVSVTDSEAGVAPAYVSGDTSNTGFLDLSESWLYQATGPATAGPYTNTGTATGYFGGIPVRATDPDNYLGVKARIEIGPLLDSNRVGEAHVLTACVYVDSGSGYALYTQPITINFSKIGIGNLSASSVPTSTGCAQTILTSNATGNSTVTAQCAFTVGGAGGASFNISTDATGDNSGPARKIWGVQACIHIEKTTNGEDRDSQPGLYIRVSDPVTWVYNVTNCGDVPLSSINVTDDKGTPGNLGDDFNPTPVDVSPADGFNDGDINKDNALDLDETWLYQASGSATVGQYSNMATATGYFGDIPVSATDPDNYLGVKARIEISPLSDSNRVGEEHVLTACVHVDTGTGYALYTQPITINFSKIGVGNLSAVSVATSTGCAQTILTSNASGNSTVTAQCLFTVGGAGGASFNIFTDATGDNSGSAKKTWVAQACIHIVKTTNGKDGPLIEVGDPVIWVYNVTNCGDVPLSSINVTDSDASVIPTYVGGDDNSNNLLDLTEAWIYQATGTATAGHYANIGYVSAKTPEQSLISYSDPSDYYNRLPVGWETYPVNKLRVLLPWIGLLVAIIAGASLLVLRRRRLS